ncbi:MAG: hypothetical protein ACM34L_14115 [Gemmatimonas sp.]|nr:hypothetical protein [Gemmatimonadaceae bacterium]
MIDPDVINFAGVMATIVASIASLCGIYVGCKWAIASTKRRELMPPPYSDARLEQLQQSVDAIAIEVERIAEAQRFSAKLLAGREAEERLPR